MEKNIREKLDELKSEILEEKSGYFNLLVNLKNIVSELKDSGLDINIYQYGTDDNIPNFNTLSGIASHKTLVNNLYFEILNNKFPIYIIDTDAKGIFIGIAKFNSSEYRSVKDFHWNQPNGLNLTKDYLISKTAEIEVTNKLFSSKENTGSKFYKSGDIKIDSFDKKEIKNGR